METSKAELKRFRRFVRGSNYKFSVNHVKRFRELGWIASELTNPLPGFVGTRWFVTEAGKRVLAEGRP